MRRSVLRAARAAGALGRACLRAACIGSVFIGAACIGSEPSRDSPLEVEASALSVSLGADAPLGADELARLVRECVNDGRRAQAERSVRRYPDVAALALSGGTAAPAAALVELGRAFDAATGAQSEGAGFGALWARRVREPERYARFERERTALLGALREGRSDAALREREVAVPRGEPGDEVLVLEALRLEGLALFYGQRAPDAADVWRRAGDVAARCGRPYEAAQLALLACAAYANAGDAGAAESAWRSAVECGERWLAGPTALADPSFWERALKLRPPQTRWPVAVLRAAGSSLASDPEQGAGASDDDALLWLSVGSAHVERGASHAALVAFSRAGASLSPSADPGLHAAARLGQARALALTGKPTEALALLAELAASPHAKVAREARAVQGALELELGRVEHGLVLLRTALEEDPTSPWPNRGRAEANLGLAFLLAGEEEEGLHWLRSAQRRFDAERDDEELVQCLDNELEWLESRGRAEEARDARARRAAAERR